MGGKDAQRWWSETMQNGHPGDLTDLRQEGRHESKSRGLGWGSPLPEAQDAGRGVTEVESRVLTPGEARQQVRVSKGP